MVRSPMRAAIYCAIAALLAGCASWPPLASEAEANFTANRAAFERLAAKIRASDYRIVSVAHKPSVRVAIRSDESAGQMIAGDSDWSDLLRQVSMFHVVREDGGEVVFGSAMNPFFASGRRSGLLGYLHSPGADPETEPCQPAHRHVDSGECVVSLGEDWYAWYEWWPASEGAAVVEPKAGPR